VLRAAGEALARRGGRARTGRAVVHLQHARRAHDHVIGPRRARVGREDVQPVRALRGDRREGARSRQAATEHGRPIPEREGGFVGRGGERRIDCVVRTDEAEPRHTAIVLEPGDPGPAFRIEVHSYREDAHGRERGRLPATAVTRGQSGLEIAVVQVRDEGVRLVDGAALGSRHGVPNSAGGLGDCPIANRRIVHTLSFYLEEVPMRTYSLRCIGQVIAVTCLVATCDAAPSQDVERQGRSLTSSSYSQRVMVPAYFSSTSDLASWSRLVDTACYRRPGIPGMLGPVVVNFSNGPEPGPLNAISPQNLDDVNSLKSCNVQVLGYVDTATQHVRDSQIPPDTRPPRSLTDIANDIKKWIVGYGVDGVFFDEAWRQGPDLTTAQVQAEEGQIDLVHDLGGISSTFNWGNPYVDMRQYVDCGIAHQWSRAGDVVYVHYESTYDNVMNYWETGWDWVQNYMPTRFITIANAAPTSIAGNESSFFSRGRQHNATGIYVINGTNYNFLADDNLLVGALQLQGLYSDYGGQDSDSVATAASACPPAAVLTPTI
jgi:hypothetical protein